MQFIKTVFGFFNDLVVRILPTSRKAKKQYGFAFLVHSRNIDDIYRKFTFLKYLPKWMAYAFTFYSWPITVSSVTGLKSKKNNLEIPGWVIGIPMTARQMIEHREHALKKITQAAILAEKKGAKIIGLGALTSSLSKGGLDLINKVNINITTGHAYTAYTVTNNLFKLVEIFNLDKQIVQIAIVGAAGSVGSTSAKIIARSGFKNILLIDLERKKHFFVDLITEMQHLNPQIQVRTSHQVQDVKIADFIITATNAPEALIKSDDLKSGAVIIDDAQPSDVSEEVLDRDDVLVIEAGVVHTPNVNNNFNFGLKSRYDNFCCMAEVLILASEEWGEHYVINRPDLSLVDEIISFGKELNFKLADFQNFKESISKTKIELVKKIAQQNHGYN